jgi:hypothetical protein
MPKIIGQSQDAIKGRIATAVTVELTVNDLNGQVITNNATTQSVVVSDALNAVAQLFDRITVIQYGVGDTYITVTGAQLTNTTTMDKILPARFSAVTLTKVANNNWVMSNIP